MRGGGNGWIADAQGHAVALLAAAAKRPDAETLAILEQIPADAWAGCGDKIENDAFALAVAIRNKIPEAVVSELVAEYGTEGNPAEMAGNAEALVKLSRAFKVATRLAPREPEPEAEPEAAPSALPPFADLSATWDLAECEIPQLFRDAMPLSELSILASEPGTGKTTLAIGLGLSVALGRGMLAGFTPNRRGRVGFFLAEDGAIPSSKRIRAWCEALEVDRREFDQAVTDGWLQAIYGDSAALLDFSTGTCVRTRAYAELAERCRTERYDLVVVDSLIEWAGCPEENSNAMMQQAAKALIDLAREAGGAVLALHHTNKLSDRNGAVGLHAIRGGSALAGKVRWAALLAHLQDEDVRAYGVPQEDRWRYLRLDVVKNQYAERPGTPLHLERGTGGILEDVKLVPPKPEEALLPLARALADKLGDNPAGISKWNLIQKKPGATFRAELKIHNPDATMRNIGLAYELALSKGFIVEEEAAPNDAGQGAIIPRKKPEKEAENAA